jgi:hypothetical protein
MWALTLAVIIAAAYLLGRVTPPNELQQAYTQAEIAQIEHYTAVEAALVPIDVAYGSLWRLLPLFGFTAGFLYLAGILYVDLVDRWATRRD